MGMDPPGQAAHVGDALGAFAGSQVRCGGRKVSAILAGTLMGVIGGPAGRYRNRLPFAAEPAGESTSGGEGPRLVKGRPDEND